MFIGKYEVWTKYSYCLNFRYNFIIYAKVINFVYGNMFDNDIIGFRIRLKNWRQLKLGHWRRVICHKIPIDQYILN